ncbi:AAA family ATPase [Streptomyces sp. NPDC048324]|uniref:McrB family protein n=1 Tax=Streptomyces sp. NPDC048324 TaxID=3157205 RepID=UPI0034409326
MTHAFADTLADPAEYLPAAPQPRASTPLSTPTSTSAAPPANLAEQIEHVAQYVATRGFVFDPWQIAAFITAVRTKPFVILAGISGTGKTKLPRLVAEATGAKCITVPVRPDWTDSSDLIGFERLDGSFQPGELLRVARQAQEHPEQQFFFVLDEMNIARVEYYLAEVLSHLENRSPDSDGRVMSDPLAPQLIDSAANEWAQVRLPDNLCLVGSVNMDETTYGFSKKVLDRAFVIEFSQVDLSAVKPANGQSVQPTQWESSHWKARALSLSSHPDCDTEAVASIIETLTEVNGILEQGQLQFGYRVRDEITMFCLAAKDCADLFATSDSGTVDPLDLAIAMKVLPRVQGGGATIRNVLDGLHIWASPSSEEEAHGLPSGNDSQYPFCADRLELMLRRLQETGFTNFWL